MHTFPGGAIQDIVHTPCLDLPFLETQSVGPMDVGYGTRPEAELDAATRKRLHDSFMPRKLLQTYIDRHTKGGYSINHVATIYHRE